MRSMLSEGIEGLETLVKSDLGPVAAKLRDVGISALTEEERELAELARRMFWKFSNLASSLTVMDPDFAAAFERFTQLNQLVSSQPSHLIIVTTMTRLDRTKGA